MRSSWLLAYPRVLWLTVNGGIVLHEATRGRRAAEMDIAVDSWRADRSPARAMELSDAARRLRAHLDQLGPPDGGLRIGARHAPEAVAFLRAVDDLDRTARDYGSSADDDRAAAAPAVTAAVLSYEGTARRIEALQRRRR